MTPAQASGRYDFVTDVPVQGPTDEGMRAADCWYAQNVLPAQPACVDCKGSPVPQWTNNSICPGNRLTYSGLGEQVRYGGKSVVGFGAPSDPAATLTPAQQAWVVGTLTALRTLIGTACPSWVDLSPNLTASQAMSGAAIGCFQSWYNENNKASMLRTDGVLDEDTLCALVLTAGLHPVDVQTTFPDPNKQHCQAYATTPSVPTVTPSPTPTPSPTTELPSCAQLGGKCVAVVPGACENGTIVPAACGPWSQPIGIACCIPNKDQKKGLSTVAMLSIGAVGAVAVGSIVYAAKGGGRRRRRRR